jgi:hypothetical protein
VVPANPNNLPTDRLAAFSHRLAQIKFIIFELVLLIVFLVFLAKFIGWEFGWW